MATNDGDDRAPRSFAFGPFVLLPARQLLIKDGASIRIGGRAFDILTALVERAGETVTKRELFSRVWPDTVVEEGNLKVNMAVLRRTLGEAPGGTPYIATIVGRGYRFVAAVQVSTSPEATSDVSPDVAAASPRNHNLPIATTRIVGRQAVIDAIRRELQDARLLSIVGTGGIGKTTVALAVAEHEVGRHRDGVWLVDLSTLKEPDLVPSSVATAIGLTAHSANMLAALCGFVRDRNLLLVLDSCEHVIEGVAAVVAPILAEAAGVTILATSREPLRVRGERVRRLAGLETPPETDTLAAQAALSYPAVQLFVDRVTDVLGAFSLGDADASRVAAICRKLDGIALAIELAATRVDVFGISGLLEQLNGRLELLEGNRGGIKRHRTLTATIDWSYDLLPDRERASMRQLSVFAGEFSLESALAVVANGAPDNTDLSADIASLVAKSLLTADVGDSDVEYRQLDTTRAYALEKLTDHELESTRRRHAEHFLALAERANADAQLLTVGSWLARYAPKIDDIRDALRWAFTNRGDALLGVRLTVAAIPFWKRLSLVEECRRAVDRALDARHDPVRTRRDSLILSLTMGATLLHTRGPLLQVKSSLTDALAAAEELGDTNLQLECLRGLSEYELWTGDSNAAISVADRIRVIAGARHDRSSADADAQAGSALSWLGALVASRRRLESIIRRPLSHDLRSEAGRFEFDQRLTARGTLATVLWLQGFPDQAVEMARFQLAEANDSNYAVSLCYALIHGSLVVSLYVRDYESARRHLEHGLEHATRHGLTIWRMMSACVRTRWDLYVGRLVDLAANREALAAVQQSGFRMRYPNYLTNYGEALARQGDFSRGLACIDEAMALSEASGQVVGMPEMLRIKGNVLWFSDRARADEAVQCYLRSIEIARRDGALSWELRSAISLVKVARQHGNREPAEAMLAAAYGRFDEGFSTGDLQRARALIDTRPTA